MDRGDAGGCGIQVEAVVERDKAQVTFIMVDFIIGRKANQGGRRAIGGLRLCHRACQGQRSRHRREEDVSGSLHGRAGSRLNVVECIASSNAGGCRPLRSAGSVECCDSVRWVNAFRAGSSAVPAVVSRVGGEDEGASQGAHSLGMRADRIAGGRIRCGIPPFSNPNGPFLSKLSSRSLPPVPNRRTILAFIAMCTQAATPLLPLISHSLAVG